MNPAQAARTETTCPDCGGSGYQVVGAGALYRCENGCPPAHGGLRAAQARAGFPDAATAPTDNPRGAPPREHWLDSHVWDCACFDCLEQDDLERDHHADYIAGIGLYGEVGA